MTLLLQIGRPVTSLGGSSSYCAKYLVGEEQLMLCRFSQKENPFKITQYLQNSALTVVADI